MLKFYKIIATCALLFIVACQQTIRPAVIPPQMVNVTLNKSGLEIIGGIEPIYFLPLKAPFQARIDTGAETSSVHVINLYPFERDGEKWVSFDLEKQAKGLTHNFEKRIKRKVIIRRSQKNEYRYVVDMDIKIGKDIINAEFSLADRDKFNYPALIGRNIISGKYMVDPSVENTLH